MISKTVVIADNILMNPMEAYLSHVRNTNIIYENVNHDTENDTYNNQIQGKNSSDNSLYSESILYRSYIEYSNVNINDNEINNINDLDCNMGNDKMGNDDSNIDGVEISIFR